MRSDSSRLSRLPHVLKRRADVAGASGVLFVSEDSVRKMGLDGGQDVPQLMQYPEFGNRNTHLRFPMHVAS